MADKMNLQKWFNENMPEDNMIYKDPACDQIVWVRNNLRSMMLNSLFEITDDILQMDDVDKIITVEQTHTSKSILLPVYCFEFKNVKIKIRGNFYDWCARCWIDLKNPIPEWMNAKEEYGFFEGMRDEKAPVSFCVQGREQLYSVIWWILNEGIKDGR